MLECPSQERMVMRIRWYSCETDCYRKLWNCYIRSWLYFAHVYKCRCKFLKMWEYLIDFCIINNHSHSRRWLYYNRKALALGQHILNVHYAFVFGKSWISIYVLTPRCVNWYDDMSIQATSSISDSNAGGKALQNIIPIIVWKISKMLILQLWRQMTDVPLNQRQGWVITHQ